MRKIFSSLVLLASAAISFSAMADYDCSKAPNVSSVGKCWQANALNAETEEKSKFIKLMNMDSSTYEVQQTLKDEHGAYWRKLNDQPYICSHFDNNRYQCEYRISRTRIEALDEQLKNAK